MHEVERRKLPRKRSLLGGKVVFNAKQSIYDCRVRNLSDGGARIALGNMLGLPRVFELHIPEFGEKHICETVWRTAGEIGVSFLHLRQPRTTPQLRVVN